MYKLAITFFAVMLYGSCLEHSSTKAIQNKTSLKANDTLKSYTIIQKGSTSFVNYFYKKQTLSGGIVVFSYDNETKGFTLWCDTIKKVFKGIFLNHDTLPLNLEQEKVYSLNGKDFKLLKLIRNKGVADGETTYFVSLDFGILISKSNVWATAEILRPETANNDSGQLTAILYLVLSDEEFYKNLMPKSKIKFTTPKFE